MFRKNLNIIPGRRQIIETNILVDRFIIRENMF